MNPGRPPPTATSASTLQLRLQTGTAEPTTVALTHGLNSLGSGSGNDIQVEHPTVSEVHCQIEVTDQNVVVRDLGSTNGTFVDNEPVQQAVLYPGQTLRLGEVELRLEALKTGETPVIKRERADTSPASETELAGMACANHPVSEATWLCTDCHRALCGACVKQVKLDTNRTVSICNGCQGLCSAPSELRRRSRRQTFSEGLLRSWSYPLQGSALILLVGASMMEALFRITGRLLLVSGMGMVTGLVVGVYVLGLLRQALLSSAEGAEALPAWDFQPQELTETALQFAACYLVSFGPWTVCKLWLHPEPGTLSLACTGLLVAGACYFPMALLAVAIYDSPAAANPLLVLLSIVKTATRYFGLCLFLAVGIGLGYLLEEGLARSGFPVLSSAAAGFVSVYLSILAARCVGWFYYCSKEQLDWT